MKRIKFLLAIAGIATILTLCDAGIKIPLNQNVRDLNLQEFQKAMKREYDAKVKDLQIKRERCIMLFVSSKINE